MLGAALGGFAHRIAARVDSAYISRQVTRMEEAAESDPELAIGTAKEFIETICRTISFRLLRRLNSLHVVNGDGGRG